MAGPLLLVENLYNQRAFPGHFVTAADAVTALEVSGHEGFRVATGRRSGIAPCTFVTVNHDQAILVACNRIRSANCLFLDRGHNLAGKPVSLQTSQDNVTWATVWTITIPTATVTNTITDTAYGVVTEEGAWGVRFPRADAIWWRLFIPAMGAGLVPVVVGLTLGTCWEPGFFLNPWGEDQDEASYTATASEWGWVGRGPVANVRTGQLGLRLATDEAYELARYHLQGHYGHGRPMWVVYDQAQADRSGLFIRPPGRLGFNFEGAWFPRQPP